VNKDSIGALGICAGGSYVIHASVSDRRVKALATVNGFLSLREFTGYNPLVTDEIRAVLLKRSNDDRQKFYETGVSENADILMPDAISAEELPAAFPEDDKKDIFDYYYARVDRCWPNFNHRFSTMSYEALIKSHALDYAKDLAIPYLGVAGSEAITKPYAERFIAEILHDYKELKIIDSARHVPTYANDEYVDQAIDALHAFYSKYI
jgi:pimeloyl-ACP methyl ester carboxylesterase